MLILITRPEVVKGDLLRTEAAAITCMFGQGLQLLHLRKPDADLMGLDRLVRSLDNRHLGCIVIHPPRKLIEAQGVEKGHGLLFDWMQDCGLSRLHITSWLWEKEVSGRREWISAMQNKKFLYSTGIHCWAELERLIEKDRVTFFSHILVSPLMDSVSKTGYKGNASLRQIPSGLPRRVQSKLFAMGGVGPANLPAIKASGFQGAALLGSVWPVLETDRKDQWQANTCAQFKNCLDIWNKTLAD